MRTTNILLVILIVLQLYSTINSYMKDRLWFKFMNEFKPVIPLIKQGLGHFFGFGGDTPNGTPN